MKINGISNNNYIPTFKNLDEAIEYPEIYAYPELYEYYDISKINAAKSDIFSDNPLSAIASKLAKAYRLLFTPKVTASADNIKKNIDILFDEPKSEKNLDLVA